MVLGLAVVHSNPPHTHTHTQWGIYWMHRSLHTYKFLYNHVHLMHHKYNKPEEVRLLNPGPLAPCPHCCRLVYLSWFAVSDDILTALVRVGGSDVGGCRCRLTAPSRSIRWTASFKLLRT